MSIPPEVYVYIVSEETYADKAAIVEEGGHGTWVYIVLEGQVKVKKKTPKGLATLYTLKEGEIFGATNLLRNTRGSRTTSVVADGEAVIGLLDANKLTEDLNALSSHLKKFISTLAKRLQDSTEKAVTTIAG